MFQLSFVCECTSLSATSVKMICKMLNIYVFVAIKIVNETLLICLFLSHNTIIFL